MAKKAIRSTNISAPDQATNYALAVTSGKAPAGPHVKAACRRHIADLSDGQSRGLTWDLAASERAIGFFCDVLRLNGGEHEGKPFIPEPWQMFVIGSLFGWKSADGFRRFRMCYIEAGKGSGKSPLAAGIGLYMLVADGEARAECYAAATKKDQAMVLYRDAVAMVDQSPKLSKLLAKSGGAQNTWNLAYIQTASFFRPISADDGQSGPRPHCALIDEIHEHKTNTVVEMMRAGTKGRRQALILMITNSGFDRTSVCFQYHEYGAKVSAGELEDDSFFSYICALDEDDDPFENESCWAKANPSIGVTFQPKYLEEQVRQARGMPSKESLVRRLNFCQWVDASNPWVDGDLWRACQGEFGPQDVLNLPCYLGLDLSARRDLTALAAVWKAAGRLYARLWFWTPKATLDERARMDNVPYRAWLTHGHLDAPEGRIVDYRFVARHVASMREDNDIQAIAFDQWRIEDFIRDLDEESCESYVWDGPESEAGDGLKLVKHGQGWGGGASESVLWMPRSITSLEEAVINKTLLVYPNPVLNWNSASAVLEEDPTGNKKWEKRKSTGRIDGIVALSMAVGAALADTDVNEEFYSGDGVMFV